MDVRIDFDPNWMSLSQKQNRTWGFENEMKRNETNKTEYKK